MSIANLFSGLSEGFNTFLSMKQAQDELAYRRHQQGLEDQARADRLQLERDSENRQARGQLFDQNRNTQNDQIAGFEKAGYTGVTPDILKQAQGNQAQTGTGAGPALGSLMQSFQQKAAAGRAAPGYTGHEAVPVGDGVDWRPPEFGRPEDPRLSPVYGPNNEIMAFDNKSGTVKPTGAMGRAPVGTSAENPRRYQDIPSGDPNHPGQMFRHDRVANTIVAVPGPGEDPSAPFLGSQAIPGQPERDASSAIALMSGAIKDLQGAYAANEYKSPGIISQEAMRHGGSLGNVAVGAMDPKYQAVYNKQQFALNNLLYLKSGKVITDNEYARLRTFIEPATGDTPQSIQDKLGRLDTEMGAIAVRAGRANPGGAVPGGQAPAAPTGRKKYTLHDGTVVE